MKVGIFLAATVVLTASSARGLDDFDAQALDPPIDPNGYVNVEGAQTLAPGSVHEAFYADYAHRPLVFTTAGRRIAAIRDLEELDAVAGAGVAHVHEGSLEVGLDMGVAVEDSGERDGQGDRVMVGIFRDLRTDVKVSPFDLDEHFWAIAARGFARWPTMARIVDHSDLATPTFLASEHKLGAGAELSVEGKIDFIRGAVNLGWEWMDGAFASGDVRLRDRLRLGAAAAIAPLRDLAGLERLELVFEVRHWTTAGAPWQRESTSPIETGGAVRFISNPFTLFRERVSMFALVGASAGLNRGVGAPDLRIDAVLGSTF